MAGPTKRTPENRAIIIAAVSKGASNTIAAQCAGVSDETLYLWLKDDAGFKDEFMRARAEKGLKLLGEITENPEPNHKKWWLSRMWPTDFAEEATIRKVLKEMIEENPEAFRAAFAVSVPKPLTQD